MKTRLTEMLGIEHPILCGGMYRLADPDLCAAISNAGALGNLTAAQYPSKREFSDALENVLKLTDKPFWVNVTLLPSIRITEEDYENYFDVIIDGKVSAVEISGTPLSRFKDGKYLKRLKQAGVKLIHKVGAVRHAVHAEKAGYDAVIAAGVEEGGHPLNENVATSVLTPRMVEAVKIPVITTGGMVNGKSLASALCLGAEGIMMASRFICTLECNVHENARRELIQRQENETVLYGNTIGLQGRALLNDSIKKVLELEKKNAGLEEILPHISGEHSKKIWKDGNMNIGAIGVGQSIGLIHKTVSCKDLIDDIMREANETIQEVKAKLEA